MHDRARVLQAYVSRYGVFTHGRHIFQGSVWGLSVAVNALETLVNSSRNAMLLGFLVMLASPLLVRVLASLLLVLVGPRQSAACLC